MTAGAHRLDDSWLYDAETVRVGCIIHGKATCCACERVLPACTDYFSPSANGDGYHCLKTACKRCVRDRYRDMARDRRRHLRYQAKAEALVHDFCVRTARVMGGTP
jgi:hypothetical protein